MSKKENHVTQSTELVPVAISEFVLGEDVRSLGTPEVAQKLEELIVRQAQIGKRSNALVAAGLYMIKTQGLWRHTGYRSWEEYTQVQALKHQTFGTRRQADRYVDAVETWVVNLGYDIALVEKYGPSILGEIAESGIVQNRTQAESWIRLLESRTVQDIRIELKENRQRLALAAPRKAEPLVAYGDEDNVSDAEPVTNDANEEPAEQPQAGPVGHPAKVVPVAHNEELPHQEITQRPHEVRVIECKDTNTGNRSWRIEIWWAGNLLYTASTGLKPVVKEMQDIDASALAREMKFVETQEMLAGE